MGLWKKKSGKNELKKKELGQIGTHSIFSESWDIWVSLSLCQPLSLILTEIILFCVPGFWSCWPSAEALLWTNPAQSH